MIFFPGGKHAVKQVVNQRSTEGLTCLHMAAEIQRSQAHYPSEDSDIMNLLINGGGDINVQSVQVRFRASSSIYATDK